MWWALGGCVVLLAAVLAFGFHARKVSRQLGEARNEIRDLEKRIRDQVELMDLLTEPDPTLDELARMSEDAAARSSSGKRGLSRLEQGAVNRILRTGPAGKAGKGDG